VRVIALLVGLLAVSACGGGGGGGGSVSAPAPVPPTAPTALSYPSPQTFTVGTTIATVTPTVSGPVTSWSVSPGLPAGLTLNAASGQIAGTPSAATAAASYTVTAQNGGGSASFALSITVNRATVARLEPATRTTLGVGQSISVFQVLEEGGSPYPRYIDAALVTWSSSAPARASINGNGVVTGLSEGSTTVTAQYQSFTTSLAVEVSGSFVARTVAVAGQGTRRYSIYVPPFPAGSTPRAAMISMHGGGGSALIQASTSQLAKFAQEQQFYAAFLEGTGVIQTFNAGACCGSAQAQNIDDVQYVRSVIDDLQANFNVNPARIFATGFSNGSMMSHRLACALSDRIAGIAAIGGGSGQFDRSRTPYYSCNPARPIPVLQVHATNDRNYPIAGGVGVDGISSTDFYPVDATLADWIARNNVTSTAAVERVTPTTTCSRYATPAEPGRPSAPVTLCRVDPPDVYDAANQVVFGGGHSWPGGVRSPGASSDVPVTDFNANAYLWGFLNP
jgi:polyhydroxybutyrate depolymerase